MPYTETKKLEKALIAPYISLCKFDDYRKIIKICNRQLKRNSN